MEETIKQEILYCQQKAAEYDKDYENNTGGKADYWKGKADTHRYMIIRLQRVLAWHGKG